MFDPPDLQLAAPCRRLLVMAAFGACALSAAQPLTPHGATGVGLVPTAEVQAPGTLSLDYGTAIPGALNPRGHNIIVAAGLMQGLELSTRLAANSMRCNLFVSDCGQGGLRDLSGSLKVQVPLGPWAKEGLSAAVGTIDVGGAASNFSATYGVITHSSEQVDLTVGAARRHVPAAPLDGLMASATLRPVAPLALSLQTIGNRRTAHALWSSSIPGTDWVGVIGVSRSLQDDDRLPRQSMQVGLSFPLAGNEARNKDRTRSPDHVDRRVRSVSLQTLRQALIDQRLGAPVVQVHEGGVVVVSVDNTHYPRDVLDALGVGLGVLAGLPPQEVRHVAIQVSRRGVPLVEARAPLRCLKPWLEGEAPSCPDLEVDALTHRRSTLREVGDRPWWSMLGQTELTVSPLVASTIGTEVGAFDADTAVSVNLVTRLWPGATFDYAHVRSLNRPTREFSEGGAFADSRIREGTLRRMIHQVLQAPGLNSMIRMSWGLGYSEFRGGHIETLTASPDGRHRIGLSGGRFDGPVVLDPLFGLPLLDIPARREPRLVRYRYAWDDAARITTEVTAGRFFGNDEGSAVLTRFRHGDSTVGVYVRRTRAPYADKPVAFAGLLLSVPLTPRRSPGNEWMTVRGNAQFEFAMESKVGAQDNLITRQHGDIPLFGEHLSRHLNNDRWSQGHFDSQIWRIRDAFTQLTRD